MKKATHKQFFNSTLMRTCIVAVLLVVVFGFDISFAQNNVIGSSIQSSLVDDLGNFAVGLIKILSRLWIIPASLAGDLITNKLAYGSAFYFDRYLFTIWQYMRTLAYFILGFVFVGSILKIFVKQEGLSKFASLLAKTVGAGLLVGFSWFIMAALIDFSIIGTSAVASIPLQAMEQEFEKLEGKVSCPHTVTIENSSSINEFTVSSFGERTLTFSDIMPKGDSVSGPLIFIGCGLLNFFESGKIPSESKTTIDVLLLVGLKLIMNIMLILPMIVLMVVNFMRLFFIWLWILFGPFIIIDTIFKGPLTNSYKKYFSLSNIFGLIFQPVVVVGALSIGLLLIMGIYDVQVGGENLENESLEQTFNVEVYENNLTKVGDGILGEVYIIGAALKTGADRTGGIIGSLFLAGFCIVLLWGLIKLGFYTNDITKGTVDSMYKTATSLMKQVPLIKTRFGKLGVGGIEQGLDYSKRMVMENYNKKQWEDADRITEFLGLSDLGWGGADWAEVSGHLNKDQGHSGSIKFIKSFKQKLADKKLSTEDPQFRRSMEKWILRNQVLLQNSGSFTGNIQYDTQTIENIWNGNDPSDRQARRFIIGLLTGNVDTSGSLDQLIRSVNDPGTNVIQQNYGGK